MERQPKKTRFSQQSLEFKAPATWGGARKGAGRKKDPKKTTLEHRKRARLKRYNPQHVTLRVERDAAELRTWRFFAAIVEAIPKSERKNFRIYGWTIQRGHLHLITESDSWLALSNGVRALEIRIARAINRIFGRTGRVIADRYHARELSTPTEVRNALVYVVQNARKHFAERGVEVSRNWLDAFSSAAWFDGWAEDAASAVAAVRARIAAKVSIEKRPIAEPRTWLLRVGWRRRGLLRVADVPIRA